MEYLVKYWVDGKIEQMKIVNEKEVFEVIDFARDDGQKISIHQLGECVLDWS